MMTNDNIIDDLDILADLLSNVERVLERLAKNSDPRLAVITALGEVDTGLRFHATRLANSLAEEVETRSAA